MHRTQENIVQVAVVYPDIAETNHPLREGVQMIKDQRIFTRIPFARSLTWIDDSGTECQAQVLNVGRGGMGIASVLPLRPNSVVTARFDDIAFGEEPVLLQAIVAWCVPEGDSYACGFTWIHGERVTLPAINAVYYSAIQDHVESGTPY